MYLVRTEYRNHDKSMYFRLKVQTFRVTYQYVPVRTSVLILVPSTYLVHAGSGGVCTLVPDSIARQQGSPAGLLASDSGTNPRIEPNHTKQVQVYSLRLLNLSAN